MLKVKEGKLNKVPTFRGYKLTVCKIVQRPKECSTYRCEVTCSERVVAPGEGDGIKRGSTWKLESSSVPYVCMYVWGVGGEGFGGGDGCKGGGMAVLAAEEKSNNTSLVLRAPGNVLIRVRRRSILQAETGRCAARNRPGRPPPLPGRPGRAPPKPPAIPSPVSSTQSHLDHTHPQNMQLLLLPLEERTLTILRLLNFPEHNFFLIH